MNIAELKTLALEIVAADQHATAGPWKVQGGGSRPLTVTAPGMMSGVLKISGPATWQARKNAELVALLRNGAPAIAGAVLSLLAQPDGDDTPEVPETTPGDTLAGEFVAAFGQTADGYAPTLLYNILKGLADFLDTVFESLGGEAVGLPVSDRTASPVERLTSGGEAARRARWDLLYALASVVSPNFTVVHHDTGMSARKMLGVLPKMRHFYLNLPDEVRGALMLNHGLAARV